MIKISFIVINVVLAIFLYFLNIWYEQQDIKIQKINEKYISDTRELQEIKKIDNWLNENVKQNLITIPKNTEEADIKLIHFFDTHAKEYSFQVEKFIYKDEMAHFLNIKYSISRGNYNNLLKFLKQEYKSGYLFIKSFNIEKTKLNGELIVVQPYPSKNKKTNKRSLEDVPQ